MKVRGLPLLALLLVGCHAATQAPKNGEEHHDEHGEGEIKLTTEQKRIAGIEVERVVRRSIFDEISVPGTVTSTTGGRAVVTPPVAGRILSVNVTLGDHVKQGQTLATMESPELAQTWSGIAEAERSRDAATASLREAESEIQLAQAKLSAAKISLGRQQELAKAGAFSQAPLQQAQSELNDAQSDLLSVQKEQASHNEAFRRLDNLFRDGIVSKSDLEAAKLELQQDQIRLDRASSRVASAKRAYEREKDIANRGLLNAREIQTAEAEVRGASLELERAKIRERSARSALKNAERAVSNAQTVYQANTTNTKATVGRVALIAPIAGILNRLDATKGQSVDRTQVLMEIDNLSSIWVTAQVPEQDANKILQGAAVRVTAPSLKNREFAGVVQVIGGRVDPKTRSIPVQCLVVGANGLLKPDMFANVFLGTGKGSASLVIPQEAVQEEDGTSFVFLAKEDEYVKAEVVVGKRSGRWMEVTGLKEGDQVVTKGTFILKSELKKSELKGHED